MIELRTEKRERKEGLQPPRVLESIPTVTSIAYLAKSGLIDKLLDGGIKLDDKSSNIKTGVIEFLFEIGALDFDGEYYINKEKRYLFEDKFVVQALEVTDRIKEIDKIIESHEMDADYLADKLFSDLINSPKNLFFNDFANSEFDELRGIRDSLIVAMAEHYRNNGQLDVQDLLMAGLVRHDKVGKKQLSFMGGNFQLDLSYFGLFSHFYEVDNNIVHYGFEKHETLPTINRRWPHNAEASGSLLEKKIIPQIVERAKEIAKDNGNKIRVADIGCGDGRALEQIVLQLIKEGIDIEVVAFDISKGALEATKRRFERVGIIDKVTIIEGDMTKREDLQKVADLDINLFIVTFIYHDIRSNGDSVPEASLEILHDLMLESDMREPMKRKAELAISEYYKQLVEALRNNKEGQRVFELMHKTSKQALYKFSEFVDVLIKKRFKTELEKDNAKVDGKISNSTKFLTAY